MTDPGFRTPSPSDRYDAANEAQFRRSVEQTLQAAALAANGDVKKTLAQWGWVNVKQFRAKGNGIANDAPALQAALDLVAEVGGGTVIVPAGTYLIKTALQIGSHTTLYCAPGATILRGAGIDNMLRNKSNGTIGGYLASENIALLGGTWDGNGAGFPTNSTLVGFGHATNVRIEGVRFVNCYNWHFIEFNACNGARLLNCMFTDHVSFDNAGEAVQLDAMFNAGGWPWFGPYDSTPCTDVLIQGCTFGPAIKGGIGSHASAEGVRHTNIRILGNHFRSTNGEALAVLQWDNLLIADNVFEDCDLAIQLQRAGTTQCPSWLVRGNIIRRSRRHGIRVNFLSDGAIIGNVIEESGQAADNTYDNIFIDSGCANVAVIGNMLRRGTGATQPRFGVNNSSAGNTGCAFLMNDGTTGGKSAGFNETVPFATRGGWLNNDTGLFHFSNHRASVTVTLSSAAAVNVGVSSTSSLFLLRDATNGATAIVLTDNSGAVTIVGQTGATTFVTAAPTATQVQLALVGGTQLTALAGSGRNNAVLRYWQLRGQ